MFRTSSSVLEFSCTSGPRITKWHADVFFVGPPLAGSYAVLAMVPTVIRSEHNVGVGEHASSPSVPTTAATRSSTACKLSIRSS